jgi:LAO/AO transport system kinase
METRPADLARRLTSGDRRALARCISGIENNKAGFEELLSQIVIPASVPTIGVTGPPGAGKSSLINALVHHWTSAGKQVGIVAVDPTSPFNQGSILGDRVRMNDHYNNPNVFIRSLATRGALGGISAKAIETVDLMKAAGFDYVVVETVGVGQSEVEIASLADTTAVVTVPEGGDEVQVIKSGLMEVGDLFVVNKADRPNAQKFVNYLQQMTHSRNTSDQYEAAVVPVVATEPSGIEALEQALQAHWEHLAYHDKKPTLLAEKAYRLIQNERMKDIDKQQLVTALKPELQKPDFNLYQFVSAYTSSSVSASS